MGSILDDGRRHYPSKDSVMGRTVNGKRVAVSHGEIRTTKKPKYNTWGEVRCNKYGRVIDYDKHKPAKKSPNGGSIWPIVFLIAIIAILLCGAP